MFPIKGLPTPVATPELIFVYNANATVYAVTIDFFHKLFSPATYQCNLCRVTYGPITMKQEWKKYLESLPYLVTFYHKDQLQHIMPEALHMTFPVILIREAGAVNTLMSTDEINRVSTVEELKIILSGKLDIRMGGKTSHLKELEAIKDTMNPIAYKTAHEQLSGVDTSSEGVPKS